MVQRFCVADRQPHECSEGDLYCCQCPHRPAPGLPRYVSFQIPRTFALLRGSLGGLLCYRPGLRAGCLLAVPDQTAEELTKRSYVPTDARGFERLEVIVATLNTNDRPGIAPGRQHQIHEKPAHPTVSVHVGMDVDEHKVPEYCTNACIGLCSQQLDHLGHRVADGSGSRRHVLATADVDLAGAVTGEIGG